ALLCAAVLLSACADQGTSTDEALDTTAGELSAARTVLVDYASTTYPKPANFTGAHYAYFKIYLPEGYDDDTSRRWPIILFLPGTGEGVSTDPAELSIHGPLKTISNHGGVAPASKGMDGMIYVAMNQPVANGNNYKAGIMEEVYRKVVADYRVDTDRFY